MPEPIALPPVIVALATVRNDVRVLGSALMCLVLGGAVLAGGLLAAGAVQVLGPVIGVVLLGLGVLIVVGWRAGRRARRDRVRRRRHPLGRDGPSLARRLGRTAHGERARRAARAARPEHDVDAPALAVALELEPADPDFGARHPELTHLEASGRYRVPFGARRELVAPLELALQARAGRRNGGVVDDGRPGARSPQY